MSAQLPYPRVLLKLSGETLCAAGVGGLDNDAIASVVAELSGVAAMGVELAIVVGGGNFLRGKALSKATYIDRPTADAMGMLATVMNALALEAALNAAGVPARAMSAIPMPSIAEPYIRTKAILHLSAKRVLILAGGTGSPFFTTDTCAALRASELSAAALLKATKVDGVFEADPVTHPEARKFDRLTYGEVLARQLGVMDLSAISLCMDSGIPVIVFRLATAGNLAKAIKGQPVGTTIAGK